MEPAHLTARFTQCGLLVPPEAGLVLVAVSVGFDGTAVALWASADDAQALSPGEGPARLADPVHAWVSFHTSEVRLRVIAIDELWLGWPHVQAMPRGEVLVVGSRCAWTPELVEPNAAVYGAEGRLVREAVLGDGIHHVRTTSNGDVWVGYTDEGVWGSLGWGTPGPTPIGRPGLARYNADLERVWAFPRDQPDTQIDDCESLTIAGDAIWSCYYTDSVLARVKHNQISTWRTDVGAITAVVIGVDVDVDQVALIGSDVTIGVIDGATFRVTSRRPFSLPGQARHRGTSLIGVGPTLHVVTPDGRWFVTDVATLEADSPPKRGGPSRGL